MLLALLLTEKDTNNVICYFCSNTYRGGIARLKNHLMGRLGNVKICPECPTEIREELWEIFNKKQHKDAATYQRVVQDVRDILGDSNEERALDEGFEETTQTTSSVVGKVVEELDEEVDEGVDEEIDHGQSEEEAATFECNDSDEEEIEGYVTEFAAVEDDVGEEDDI
ncbi:hypothetical protein TanjilG_17698 [Lupinus angustifolius]|uniref:BED-type domain-containing protein n=1 Tax=Lupinus angustifolius TaxID=3871 RepID=A0A1J7H156_LUPAN|nr:hypothetical protein TanjilG_17698 [Lupinus angustifolius]